MQVILLRHGKTEANLQGRYAGRTDEPLCAEGIAQARSVPACPQVERVYVSPLRRAAQTAAICFPHAPQIVSPGLREMDFGAFDGLRPAELENDPAYQDWLHSNCQARCPGGESLAEYAATVRAAFSSIIDDALAAMLRSIAVVGHSGTLMAIMHGFSQQPGDYFDWFVSTGQGFITTVEEHTWRESRRFLATAAFARLVGEK